jgi:putative sterol carrier protein
MSAFTTKDQAVSVFTELFEIMLADETFSHAVTSQHLSVLFLHDDLGFTVFVDGQGVYVDHRPYDPAITIKMSTDVADALWAGRLLMPMALATRKIRVKGKVSKVIEFVPLLQPAFDQYPTIAAAAGVGAAA